MMHGSTNAQEIRPAPRPATVLDSAAHLDATALDFARADHCWRILAADRRNWTDPRRQRVLAAAFLRYHVAKLALEDLSGLSCCAG